MNSQSDGDPDLIGELECEGEWINTKSGKRFFKMKPFHEKHGSKRKADGNIDMSDAAKTVAIAAEYAKKIASGEFKILGGSEIDLTGGKWARTFIIDEGQ